MKTYSDNCIELRNIGVLSVKYFLHNLLSVRQHAIWSYVKQEYGSGKTNVLFMYVVSQVKGSIWVSIFLLADDSQLWYQG